MRERAINSLLTAYYAAPGRIAFLMRRLGELQARVAYLETELGDSAKGLKDFTLPGTVAGYGGPAARSNRVGNPVVAALLRLRAVRPDAMQELREKYAAVHCMEGEIDDITRFQQAMTDLLNSLDPGDRTLVKLYYHDKLTFEQIACREGIGATESVPRKRLHQVEQQITEAVADSRSTTKAGLWPIPGRFRADSGPKVGRL